MKDPRTVEEKREAAMSLLSDEAKTSLAVWLEAEADSYIQAVGTPKALDEFYSQELAPEYSVAKLALRLRDEVRANEGPNAGVTSPHQEEFVRFFQVVEDFFRKPNN